MRKNGGGREDGVTWGRGVEMSMDYAYSVHHASLLHFRTHLTISMMEHLTLSCFEMK